jgi:D-alanyl-D-alanine carboxypeptidase
MRPLLLLLATACAGPSLPDPSFYDCDDTPLGARSDHPRAERNRRLVEDALELGTPGVSVAVIDTDGTWLGAGGLADLELGVEARPCHRWHVASTTKMLAATSALRLEEDGLLTLDAPAKRWLSPEVVEHVANVADGVTVRQLMAHTAGVPDYLTLGFFLDAFNGALQPSSAAEELERIHGAPADFEAGTDFEYSNANYLLLSLVLAEAAGMPAYDVVHEQVTEPLGLVDTLGRSEEPTALVRGYLDLHGDGTLIDFTDNTTAVMAGAGKLDGGFVSTPRDLAVLVRALAHGTLLGEASTEAMQSFRPYGPDDVSGIEDAYGLGLARVQTRYGPAIGHYGTVHPYQTVAFHLVEHDTTIVLAANGYVGDVGDWINSEAPFRLLFEESP